jgi:D-serine dehydratase
MKSVLQKLEQGKEVFFNCKKQETEEMLTQRDIDDAWERIARFSNYVKAAYPETEINGGFIDSPIQLIMKPKTNLKTQKMLLSMVICMSNAMIYLRFAAR